MEERISHASFSSCSVCKAVAYQFHRAFMDGHRYHINGDSLATNYGRKVFAKVPT